MHYRRRAHSDANDARGKTEASGAANQAAQELTTRDSFHLRIQFASSQREGSNKGLLCVHCPSMMELSSHNNPLFDPSR